MIVFFFQRTPLNSMNIRIKNYVRARVMVSYVFITLRIDGLYILFY
jgi:hypothetical protein